MTEMFTQKLFVCLFVFILCFFVGGGGGVFFCLFVCLFVVVVFFFVVVVCFLWGFFCFFCFFFGLEAQSDSMLSVIIQNLKIQLHNYGIY